MTTPSTPAGWYPDPDDSHGRRYWDGTAWTEDRSPTTPPEPVAEAPAPEVVEPDRGPSLEPVELEQPTFESFETPSFESIASGSFDTPAPPPPATEVTSALEVPGTFDEPESPEASEAPEPPAAAVPTFAAPSYSPTWASDAPNISQTPAAFARAYDSPPPGRPGPAGSGGGAGGPDNRRLIIGFLSAVGALLLILILILVYAFVIRDKPTTHVTSSNSPRPLVETSSSEAAETTPETKSESETTAEAGAVAGEIVDGPFTISVGSTERGDTISSTVNESLQKTAVGEFFVVYLNVGNTSGDVQEFLSALQVLNTDAGTIAPDDEASLYLGGGVVSVSAGEVTPAAVAFDVPIGTVPSGIVVHGVPGMAGGELPL